MSTVDPTPGDDDAVVPENDRSFLMDQSPVEVDDDAVAANLAAETGEDEPGGDADAARD